MIPVTESAHRKSDQHGTSSCSLAVPTGTPRWEHSYDAIMAQGFQNDLDQVATDLIAAFGLAYDENGPEDLNDPLLRWLDHRSRYVEPRPRTVLKSANFELRLPADAQAGLAAFIDAAKAGRDLNLFQTNGIKKSDTSGRKRQRRTDLLWADWGILHAHLTDAPTSAGAEFSQRSDWLLFFVDLRDQLLLIDVRAHAETGVFQARDIAEKMLRSWPELAARYEMRGILPPAPSAPPTGSEVKALREGGVSGFLVLDGKVYAPPGMGVTTASTATRVSLLRNRVRSLACDIEAFVSKADSAFMRAAREHGETSRAPRLGVNPDGDLVVFIGDVAIRLNRTGDPSDAGVQLHDRMLPPWAGNRLVSWHRAQQDTSSIAP